MKINTRIKLLRLLIGMTQEELAFQVEIPRATLGHYEIGSYIPRDMILMQIAEILGVEPGYIRYGSPVIRNQVWIPSIPKHSKSKQTIYEDIEKLIPEFIQENAFTSLVVGKLADGNQTLLFGRNMKFDCLLLISPNLADKLITASKGLEHYTIADNPFGTVELFDDNCIMFILTEIESFGFTLDFNEMLLSLMNVPFIKNRSISNLDAVIMEYAARNNDDVRDKLLRVANIISMDLLDGVTLEQLVEKHERNENLSVLNVSSYSDPVSKTLCVILKTAFDLLAREKFNS